MTGIEASQGVPTIETGTDKLVLTVAEGVAELVFNNPARRNALSFEMVSAIPAVLGALDSDPEVRVLLITGAGDAAFMSGADISEFGARRTSTDQRGEYDAASARSDDAWEAFSKPIVAMINGFCIGRGMLTAMQADLRIAAEGSTFAVPAGRLGVGYGYRGVTMLTDVISPAYAAELLLTARRFSAGEALQAGIVNQVVPAADLRTRTAEITSAIASNAPLTLAACKAALREARKPEADRDLNRVSELVERCFQSDDYREGQLAFAEKRTPRFKGR